jgi:SAM-dependent methyltransferase
VGHFMKRTSQPAAKTAKLSAITIEPSKSRSVKTAVLVQKPVAKSVATKPILAVPAAGLKAPKAVVKARPSSKSSGALAISPKTQKSAEPNVSARTTRPVAAPKVVVKSKSPATAVATPAKAKASAVQGRPPAAKAVKKPSEPTVLSSQRQRTIEPAKIKLPLSAPDKIDTRATRKPKTAKPVTLNVASSQVKVPRALRSPPKSESQPQMLSEKDETVVDVDINGTTVHDENHEADTELAATQIVVSDTTTSDKQGQIDSRNSSFWDELCGTHLASSLGVVDNGPESLGLFDKWFFDIYPYLDYHLNLPDLKNKRVLEIGLGYGSVGQYIAQYSGEYMGLDIAAGPVNMMKHRMKQAGLNGDATQGSILDAPFPDQSFDVIIAFGCLHHSGDLQRAFNECRRLLKPGGRLTLMVYYAYSYRRFEHQFKETWAYLRKELAGYRGVIGVSDDAARAAADTNAKGEAAPHTDWIGAASLKVMLKRAGFSNPKTKLENIDQAGPYVQVPREEGLKSRWPSIWGLDIFASAWVK